MYWRREVYEVPSIKNANLSIKYEWIKVQKWLIACKKGINVVVLKKRGLYLRTMETGRKVFWVRSFAAINKEHSSFLGHNSLSLDPCWDVIHMMNGSSCLITRIHHKEVILHSFYAFILSIPTYWKHCIFSKTLFTNFSVMSSTLIIPSNP